MLLRRAAFWLFLVLLGAVASHAALLLYVPRQAMGSLMRELEDRGLTNRMGLFSAAEWRRLERRADPGMLYAACVIRLEGRRVRLKATVPAGAYWSVTVYAPEGNVIYALDDRFASRRHITLLFAPAAALRTEGRLAAPEIAEGTIRLPMERDRALAVIRTAAPWPGMRPRLQAALENTRCEVETTSAPADLPAAAQPASAGQGRGMPSSVPVPRPRPATRRPAAAAD